MVWADLSEPDAISKVLLRGSREGGIGGHVATELEVGAMQPEASRNGEADTSSPANSDAIEDTGVRLVTTRWTSWSYIHGCGPCTGDWPSLGVSFLGGQVRRVRA